MTNNIPEIPVQQREFSIDTLVNKGQVFHDPYLLTALRNVYAYATEGSVVAFMPYLIAGKATS